MRRYNLRLSVLSLSTLVVAVLYTPKSSEAWGRDYYPGYGGANAFSSMGDVDWGKRSYPGYGGANAYSSMGDVDWGKRSIGAARQFGDSDDKRNNNDVKRAGGIYRNWLSGGRSPGYARAFHSMADSDWGWRKRAEISAEDDHEAPVGLYKNFLMKKGRGYKHRPNYGYQPRKYRNRSYYYSPRSSSVTSRRAPSIKRPRASNYHSMADMDWGWKRKKRTREDLFSDTADFPDNDRISDEELNDLLQLLYENNVEDSDDLDVSKRNIGSVLRVDNDKRSVASLARNNGFSVDGKENGGNAKRNVAALARNGRTVASLMKGQPARPQSFGDAAPGME